MNEMHTMSIVPYTIFLKYLIKELNQQVLICYSGKWGAIFGKRVRLEILFPVDNARRVSWKSF